MNDQRVTGWDTGLSQDYDRGLAQWFASRLGAREDLRRAMLGLNRGWNMKYVIGEDLKSRLEDQLDHAGMCGLANELRELSPMAPMPDSKVMEIINSSANVEGELMLPFSLAKEVVQKFIDSQ